MKLSDYIVYFLQQRGVGHIFGMSGGSAVHLLDSVSKCEGIEFVCSQHEQCGAISADGYARTTGKLGVAIATSGPGATNLLTGTCCSYFDSIPTLMLTGQVATHRLKRERKIRQMGFQETDVLSIYSSVTKFAAQLHDPDDIRYLLEKAYHMAFEGRPGSVLLDIPDNLQRAQVEHNNMRSYIPESVPHVDDKELVTQLETVVQEISKAERPVVVLGGGIKTPIPELDVSSFLERLGVPVLSSWAALDCLPDNSILKVGAFGVYGPRAGNYTVQNADFVLCLGARLSQNLTGGVLESFARSATIAMVDVCLGEMDKFDGTGISIEYRIQSRLDRALPALDSILKRQNWKIERTKWVEQIHRWKNAFKNDLPDPDHKTGHVGAYAFVKALARCAPEEHLLFVDTGGNLTWTCNGFSFKRGQRLFSAWNNTPMGYALPAAIGASAANPNEVISCIIGDGGLMICLSELATIVQRNMNIAVFLFNNHGHGIQKQTLETWLEGNYVGVHEGSGLAFTDFPAVASAMGLRTVTIDSEELMDEALEQVFSSKGPVFINVEINPDQRLYPVLKYGAALEDQLPSLSDAEIEANMLISPYKARDL